MSWNYRVIHFTEQHTNHVEDVYMVVEVYYDEAGKPNGWKEARVIGNTLKECNENRVMLFGAFKRRVLEWDGKKLKEPK